MSAASATSVYPEAVPATIIEAGRGYVRAAISELWVRRELVYFLVRRDTKVRYQQTAIGILWAILQPALTMLIFSIIFGRFAKIPSEGIPYSVFSLCAIVPWIFFSTSVNQGSNSLVNNAPLLSKIYLPRLALPLSTVLASMLDFALSFCLLLCIMAFHRVAPSRNIYMMPAFLLVALLAALGITLWLAALNVRFRDVRYAVPFMLQIWLFATPIAYPSSLIPERWRLLYSLNPMVGVIDGFRYSILGVGHLNPRDLGVMLIVTIGLLVTGCMYFIRVERRFADII